MKKCPFCGANIEDSSQFCLYCMQSLTEKEQILPLQKKQLQWLLILAAIVASIAVVSVALVIIMSGRGAVPNHQSPSETQRINATTTTNQATPSDPLHIHNYCIENTATEYRKNEATCITPAIFYYSCTCGEKGSETFPYGVTANHTIVTKPGYAATCKTSGLTEGKNCSVCNAVLSSQSTIPIVNHTYDNDQDESCNVCNYVRVLNCRHGKTVKLAAVSPTCTAGGLTEGKKCSLCEKILTAQTTLAPSGHRAVADQAIAPTCTTDGKTAGKHCSVCQIVLVYQQHLPALGHSFDPEDVRSPCSVCGASSPHTHSYSVQNTSIKYQRDAATCLAPAVYYYSCTCGEKGSETFTHGETGEHIAVTKPGYPATCDTPGLSDCRYCSVCQTTFQPHWETPVLGHTYAVGDSPTPCLVCRKMGAVVVQAPDSQYFQNNIFQINSITYTIKPLGEDSWAVSVSINCTNVSSSDAHMSPDASLRFYDANGYWTGCGNGTIYSGWVQPNESDTCVVKFSIPNSTDVFKLAVS